MQVSFTPEFADRLENEMDLGNAGVHNPHGGGNTYALERALEEDMLLTSVGWANSYYQGDGPYTDEWGVEWDTVEYTTNFGNGKYTEITSHPLAQDHLIDSYTPPDPTRPELFIDAEQTIANFKDDFYIVGVTVTTIFETAWALRGLEKLMIDFVLDPDLATRILDIPFAYHLEAAKRLVKLGVDMIWIGDDVGTQNAMLISPELWKKLLQPKMAEFIGELRKINPGVKIAYHSDGIIDPIIPELIEIGVDVLNPIQPSCMDPAEVNKKYGNNLCFWGTIDEQYTLPFGTPEEVRGEVRHRIDTVGKNGGLIIGPTHHVQLDTPMENFWAMVDTIRNTKYSRVC
jgi:uroporphyrinogen decarboxylase